MLSGRGFCDSSIFRPESPAESEMSECDRETSTPRRPRFTIEVEPRKKSIENVYVNMKRMEGNYLSLVVFITCMTLI
jgi:hypothetical protein